MPRKRPVPSYCRHKADNRAYVKIRGHRTYLGKWNSPKSKAEYRRILQELETRPEAAPLSPPAAARAAPDITVNRVAIAFLDHVDAWYRKADGRPTSEPGVVRIALGVVCSLYGHTTAATFGPIAFKAVRDAMIERGWARRSINKHMNRVARMFKWAAANELVSGSIYQGLRTVEGLRAGRAGVKETAPIGPVDQATVDATLPHLSSVVAAMVRLQRLTGMRPGEVCLLRACDVDRSGDVWLYTPRTHKTEHHGKSRRVPIGPRGQAVLAPFLARAVAADAPVFSPADATEEMRAARSERRRTPLNQGNRPGTNRQPIPLETPRRAYSVSSFSRAVRRACEFAFGMPKELREPTGAKLIAAEKKEPARRRERRAKLAAWHAANCWYPNQLRHAAATLLRSEFGLEAAQVMLGHSRADVTQVYAERDVAKALEVARKVG